MADISYDNILTDLDEDAVLPTYLGQVARLPAREKRRRTHWSAPVKSLQMRAPQDWLHVNMRLADFGETQKSSGHKLHLIQPNPLRAPEVILQTGWGAKADIWNLGCVVSRHHTIRQAIQVSGLADCHMSLGLADVRTKGILRWASPRGRRLLVPGSSAGNGSLPRPSTGRPVVTLGLAFLFF